MPKHSASCLAPGGCSINYLCFRALKDSPGRWGGLPAWAPSQWVPASGSRVPPLCVAAGLGALCLGCVSADATALKTSTNRQILIITAPQVIACGVSTLGGCQGVVFSGLLNRPLNNILPGPQSLMASLACSQHTGDLPRCGHSSHSRGLGALRPAG